MVIYVYEKYYYHEKHLNCHTFSSGDFYFWDTYLE